MNYQNIEPRNIENGNGIRCVLWVSGCDHNCEGCFNPQTHDPKSGIEFDKDALDEIHDALNAEYCAGLTLSGGDPLFKDNLDTVLELCKMVKEEYHKTVWMWTGSIFESLILDNSEIGLKRKEILQYVDVLVDGPFIQSLASKEYHWAGSTNQRVIKIPDTLKNLDTLKHTTPDFTKELIEKNIVYLENDQEMKHNESMKSIPTCGC